MTLFEYSLNWLYFQSPYMQPLTTALWVCASTIDIYSCAKGNTPHSPTTARA